jgi:steroid delta-isomerase-like uncharacterized protein
MYSEDASLTPASSGTTVRGRASIREMLASFAAGFPDLQARTTHLFLVGPRRLIAITHNRGTNSVALGGIDASNKATSFLNLTVTDVDDAGLITRQIAYADNLNFLGQIGQLKGVYRSVDAGPAGDPIVARTGSAPAEGDHTAMVRTFAALFGSHDRAAVTRLYATDGVLDDLATATPVSGSANLDRAYAALFSAFPDIAMTDLELAAAGDHVVATYRLTATHAGAYAPLGAERGSMRQLELEAAATFHIVDGKIVRHTVFVDGMAAARQLGLFDVPAGTPP